MADMTLEQVANELRITARHGASLAPQTCHYLADAIDAAIKQREQDAKDVARLEWYFGPSDKKDWLNTYMRGVREGWSVGQWRAAIDAAMAEESGNE